MPVLLSKTILFSLYPLATKDQLLNTKFEYIFFSKWENLKKTLVPNFCLVAGFYLPAAPMKITQLTKNTLNYSLNFDPTIFAESVPPGFIHGALSHEVCEFMKRPTTIHKPPSVFHTWTETALGRNLNSTKPDATIPRS